MLATDLFDITIGAGLYSGWFVTSKFEPAIRSVMPFRVKITLVAFLGDTDHYPCHLCHEIGDEIIFDGEKYTGRLCPVVWPLLTPKVAAIYTVGPRHAEPLHYFPFWYPPLSVKDPSPKKYDGPKFNNVLETVEEPPYHMARLQPPTRFQVAPHEGEVAKEIHAVFPDTRPPPCSGLKPSTSTKKFLPCLFPGAR